MAAAATRTSAAGGATSGTTDRTVTITPAVGDLIIVFVNVSVNTNAAPTMSDNNGSGTYTLIGTALWNTSANIMSAFVRDTLILNTTSTVITAATGSNTAGELVAVAISGMGDAGISAIRQFAVEQNKAAAATPAPVFASAVNTANITLGAVGNLSSPATLTPPTNWSELQDVGQLTPNTGLEVVNRDSGFTGTTVTWGGTSATAFADIVLELNCPMPPPPYQPQYQQAPHMAS